MDFFPSLQGVTGKVLRSVASCLLRCEVIQRVAVAGDVSVAGKSEGGGETTKLKAYQLLHPLTAAGGGVGFGGGGEEEEVEESGGEEEGEGCGVWPLVSELPVVMQAYRCIESFGSMGITSSVSHTHSPQINHCPTHSIP